MGKSEIPPRGTPSAPRGKVKRRTASLADLQTLPNVTSTKRPRPTPETADSWAGRTGRAADPSPPLQRSLSSRNSMTGPVVPQAPPQRGAAVPTPEAMAELLAAAPEEFDAAIGFGSPPSTPSSQASTALPAAEAVALLTGSPALQRDGARGPNPTQQTLFTRGKELLAAKQFAAAAARFERLVALDPKDGRAHFYLAAARWHAASDASQRLAAAQSARQAVACDSQDAQACMLLVEILLTLGKHQPALEVAKHLAKLQPGWAVGHLGQAQALVALGRDGEALSSLDATLARDPQHFDALVLQGHTLSRLGRHGEALQSFDAALDQQPQKARVRSMRNQAMHAFIHWSKERGRFWPL